MNSGQDYTARACLKETKAPTNHKNTEELVTLDFSFVLERADENLLTTLQGTTDCGLDREWSYHSLDVPRSVLVPIPERSDLIMRVMMSSEDQLTCWELWSQIGY